MKYNYKEGSERYDVVRELNPQQFSVLYGLAMKRGVSMDEMVDELRNVECDGRAYGALIIIDTK